MMVSNLEYEFNHDPKHRDFMRDLKTVNYPSSVGIRLEHIPTGLSEFVWRYPGKLQNKIEAANIVFRRVTGKMYHPKSLED